MTVRESTIQAGRTWLKVALGLTDQQVIPADDPGGRPPIPYVTIDAFAFVPVAQAEQFDDLDGNGDPQRTTAISERCTLAIQTFGEAAGDWIKRADLALYRGDVQAALRTAGLTVVAGGSNRPTTLEVGAGRELRQAFDFEARYTLTEDTPEALTAADVVALTTDLRHRDGDTSTLQVVTAIDL